MISQFHYLFRPLLYFNTNWQAPQNLNTFCLKWHFKLAQLPEISPKTKFELCFIPGGTNIFYRVTEKHTKKPSAEGVKKSLKRP